MSTILFSLSDRTGDKAGPTIMMEKPNIGETISFINGHGVFKSAKIVDIHHNVFHQQTDKHSEVRVYGLLDPPASEM